MMRPLTFVISLMLFSCSSGSDEIELDQALQNTKEGEYNLVAIADDKNFASFQKSANHKKQYYYDAGKRGDVLEKIAEAVTIGRESGHEIHTMGLNDFLEE